MKCTTEADRIAFIQLAISDHEADPMFKMGRDAGQFYRGVDTSLENMKNFIYDAEGTAYEDKLAPNHKIVSNFFYLFTTQLVSWLLGNGVSFDNPEIKKRLGGADFDYKVQQVLAYAACDGEGYGLVTEDGIVPLCFACKLHGKEPLLIPLYDEDDGSIRAAIRYWRLSKQYPLRATLYEEDGFTEYKGTAGAVLELYQEKSNYNGVSISNNAQGVYYSKAANYSGLPIVPMGFINSQSALAGKKETLVAYDLVMSAMVNDIDLNKTYWKIKNADGMDKIDDMNLLVDIYKSHVIHERDDIEVEKEELASNPANYAEVLQALTERLYTDFQAVDVRTISSGNKTTVEIQSAYTQLNLKCDEVEKYVSDFIRGCMRVIGIDPNEPFHFQRPKEINQSEFISMIISAGNYLGDETVTKLICESLGLIDEYEDIMQKKQGEEIDLFSGSDKSENAVSQIIAGVVEGVKAAIRELFGRGEQ